MVRYGTVGAPFWPVWHRELSHTACNDIVAYRGWYFGRSNDGLEIGYSSVFWDTRISVFVRAYLLIQDVAERLRAVDDHPIIPTYTHLKDLAIHGTPFSQASWCLWRQADADSDQRVPFRPGQFIQPAVTAEPC